MDILGAYGASPDVSKALSERLDHGVGATATTPQQKRSLTRRRPQQESSASGPVTKAPDTPSTFASQKQTPASQRFESRQNSGTVSATLNCGNLPVPSAWRGQCSSVSVTPVSESSVVAKQYRYMFQKVSSKSAALDDWLAELEVQFAERLELPVRGHPGMTSQTEMTTVGRVCCDSESERVRANASSLVLECSREFGGCRVPLNLKSVNDFSLFPGQIVAVDGTNTVGSEFSVTKIHQLPMPPPSTGGSISEPLTVVIAAGPFSVDDNLTYKPLQDLMEKVATDPPDVLILLGPFVDAYSEEVKKCTMEMTFEDFFRALVRDRILNYLPARTHLVLVPSCRDVHHHSVYPQAPFPSWPEMQDRKSQIHLLSDPANVHINGVNIAWTSIDILMQLNRQEVCSGDVGDKPSRLAAHILQQQCFCPTLPAPKDVNVEVDQLLMEHDFLPNMPHILLLPSDFTRGFIKNVGGCVCINPSRLAKGLFARIAVHPTKDASSIVSSSVAQLLCV